MRIGIVGLGSIAHRVYLPLLCNRQDVEIVGLMSRSDATVTQAGRTYRIDDVFTDLGDLLARKPELVFVHAPTVAHTEIVTACLAANAAVYVDKPVAYNLADCEEMASRAAAGGLLLAVGFNRRFAPMYVRARDWVTAHGDLRLANMEKHRAAAPLQTAREAVYDDLIHVLDTLLWLLGEQVAALPVDLRVDQTAGFRMAAGALCTPIASASYSMIRSVGADLERLAVHADGRSAEVVDLDRATFDGPDGRRLATFPSWDTVVERRGFTALVQHVLDTVGTPERCEVAATRVMSTHRLAESIVANA
ncbi:MAG TPA: Gfo/Idh/MocA family oxidoreductase [Actinomycetes bacterium]